MIFLLLVVLAIMFLPAVGTAIAFVLKAMVAVFLISFIVAMVSEAIEE